MADLKLNYEHKILKVADLISAEYNPRKINGKELDDLKDSIKRFGLVEPIVVNGHKARKNIIISGHQRISICKELGMVEVPCNVVNLDIEMEKELNIRMNKAGGSFDNEMLDKFFDRDKLIDFGFTEDELPTIEIESDTDIQVDNPVYPIVPVLSEKYDYVVIVATNEIDIAYMDNFFDVQVEESYKNSKVGVGRVVTFDKFQKLVRDERVG